MNDKVFHSFEFGGFGENKGVKILDYRYGKIFSAPRSQVLSGTLGQQFGYTGFFPIQEDIYVKWQVLRTGQVFEKKVRLNKEIKMSPKESRIRFVILDEILRIYIISYEFHDANTKDCELPSFKKHQCERLFPEN